MEYHRKTNKKNNWEKRRKFDSEVWDVTLTNSDITQTRNNRRSHGMMKESLSAVNGKWQMNYFRLRKLWVTWIHTYGNIFLTLNNYPKPENHLTPYGRAGGEILITRRNTYSQPFGRSDKTLDGDNSPINQVNKLPPLKSYFFRGVSFMRHLR